MLQGLLSSPGLVRVLSYLDVRDRCAAAGTSRAWYGYHLSPDLWAHLSLAGLSHLVVRDGVVASLLARHRAAVRVLDLSLCSRLTDAALVAAAEAAAGMPPASLQAASLEGCRGLGDAGVAALAAANPALTHLNLAGCAGLSPRGIQAVVERCPGLSSLVLDSVPGVTDAVLASLGRSAPSLSALSVGGCSGVTNGGVGLFAQYRGLGLREIKLAYCAKLGDECVVNLVSACAALQAVSLYGCSKVTDAALHWLGRLPQLTSLDVSMCRNVTDAGLTALVAPHRGASPLRSLNLYDCAQVTDAGLAALAAGSPGLSFLGVFGLDRVTLNGLRGALARWPSLARLDAGGGIGEDELAALAREMVLARAAGH